MSLPILLGPFELRPTERVLRGAEGPLAVGARAFDVLLALAERSDRLVSKNELMDVVWPGTVVEDNNLTVQISALRKVLGASAIVTVNGRGYRLALPVRRGPHAAAEPEAAPPPALHTEPQRQLLVIALADVVGWSRLVSRDATGATQAWKRVRGWLETPALEREGGRLIEITPGRVLIAFTSAVLCVSWALGLQRQLRQLRAEPRAIPLHMRIGICADDVIVDEGKLVGEGVHLAHDIQQLAGHDDVLVTPEVRDFVQHKLPARFEPLGERLLARQKRRLPLFRARDTEGAAAALASLPADRQATIAVLPLTEQDGEAGYFGNGLTEDIIAALSLNRALFVIAHSSTLRFREAADPVTVGAELGVRYLVSGQVRRAGQQLRIAVSLAQTSDAQVIWREHYDGSDEQVFDFQSRIAASVSAKIAPVVLDAEVARVRNRPTEVFGAYDCVLQALPGMYRFDSDDFERCGELLKQAVQLDPEYAQAHAHLGWWHSLCAAEGRTGSIQEHRRMALDHALLAVRLDSRDAYALAVAGHLMTLLQRQHEQALELFEQALAIDPSNVWAWARSATTLAYLGQGEEALRRARHAMRLSPFDRSLFSMTTTCAIACLVAGRPDEAVAWLGKSLRLNPSYVAARRLMIAALSMVSEHEEARAVAQDLLAEHPGFNLEDFASWYPLRQPYLDQVLQALRRAGIPHRAAH